MMEKVDDEVSFLIRSQNTELPKSLNSTPPLSNDDIVSEGDTINYTISSEDSLLTGAKALFTTASCHTTNKQDSTEIRNDLSVISQLNETGSPE